jgi:hypothetical protein
MIYICVWLLSLLFSHLQMGESVGLLPNVEVSKLIRVEGDPRLEEYSLQMYKQYVNLVSRQHIIEYLVWYVYDYFVLI